MHRIERRIDGGRRQPQQGEQHDDQQRCLPQQRQGLSIGAAGHLPQRADALVLADVGQGQCHHRQQSAPDGHQQEAGAQALPADQRAGCQRRQQHADAAGKGKSAHEAVALAGRRGANGIGLRRQPAHAARQSAQQLQAAGAQEAAGQRIQGRRQAGAETRPEHDAPVAVAVAQCARRHRQQQRAALVQGNIAQDLKFNEDALPGTLETYLRLTLQNPARLTILPETALPLLRHEVPQQLVEQLRGHARQNGGDILIGAFERNNGSYYNSVFTLGTAGEQHYRKQHLVPFGEFIPLRPLLGWLINGVLDIPMGDLARGDARQAPFDVAGQRVAANICYEDVFGEEIIRALPEATLLVNFTNDAWYGHSHAAAQHNQISQLRALEAGRMMLRATNTGVTSIIGADGRVLQQLPQHQEAVLNGMAQGYQGITPYVRWGNAAVMLLIALMLAYAWLRRYTSPEKGRSGGVKG